MGSTSKYCIRLKSYCQYRNTEYCPLTITEGNKLPPAPECKKIAHATLERSLERN